MTSDKVLNKQIFKKWWFWVIVVVILGLIGFATQDNSSTTDTANNSDNTSDNTTQSVGTLPTLDKADYTDQEGLVVFKDLKTKGYNVAAKYVNEKVPATNQEFTEQFTNADVNSCSDRLGFDAYLVSDVTQNGDSVALTLTNQPNNNQTCPVGTKNDL